MNDLIRLTDPGTVDRPVARVGSKGDPFDLDGAVLVMVDFQQGFDAPSWPPRWNACLDANASALLAAFRAAGRPVIHVRHDSLDPGSPLRPGQSGNAFRVSASPLDGEAVISKSVNAAFIGTDLDLRLRRIGARAIVVCGISTDMCVSTTVRVGANLGWPIVVVGDACDCFALPGGDGLTIPAETVHRVHLATLAYEFCTVAATHEIVAALERTAGEE